MPSHTFRARAFVDTDGWWTVEVPELSRPDAAGGDFRALTSSPTARGIGRMARELAATILDVPEDQIEVIVDIEIPPDIARLWADGAAAEHEARGAVARAAALRREAVRQLRERGYTTEAAASALGVSRQRVQQLAPRQTGRSAARDAAGLGA